MTASSTFRELSLSPGADLDNKVPAGLNVTGPRKGGPINLRYGDFELTLVSPGSILTQATLALAGSGNAATKARMIAHVTGPLVELGD